MAINKNHSRDSLHPTTNILIVSAFGSFVLPIGTTSQRPSSPTLGMMRFNSTTGKFEVYTSSWMDLKVGNYVRTLNFEGSAGITISSNISGEDYSYEIRLTNTGVIPGTYTKVTVDNQGRITSGVSARLSDLEPPITNINLNNFRIISLANPVDPGDAATKSYVDNLAFIEISSFGGGSQISIGVSGNREIHLRTLVGSGIVETSTSGNVIQISAARSTIEISSLGGVSLGLNVSAGTGNRNELRIRGLVGGGIIEVSALSDVVSISASPVSTNITNSALGGGINPILAVSGGEILTRTFVGGGIVEVSAVSDGRIIISASQYNIQQNITLSSFGNGEQIGIGVSGNSEIQLRTLVGGGIVETSISGNVIQISASRSTIEISSLGGVSLGLNVSAGTGNRNELRIRGLVGGGIIEVSALSDVVSISASPASINITNSALGGGIDPILAVSGGEIITRTFVGGGIVEVSATSDGRIIVSGASQVQNLSLSSLANGVDVISNVSGSEIIQRRIQGKGIVDVRLSSNGTVVVSSIGAEFVESNFRLITQRNFFVSPGILNIPSDLSAYNEVYITFFNVFPSAANDLAFRLRINGVIASSYTYNAIVIISGLGSFGIRVNYSEVGITGSLDAGTYTRRRRAASGYLRIFSPNNLNLVSASTSWISEMRHMRTADEEYYLKTVGRCLHSTSTGTKLEGIRIFIIGGTQTIMGGLIKVYGRL